jgi:hypothetical protein
MRAYFKLRRKLRYDERNWLRVVQIDAFSSILDRATDSNVLEISPGWNSCWREKPHNSYIAVEYPEFDICRDVLPQRFNIVIADQVLEHVQRPIEAAKHIFAMTAPGGIALVATPFLFRVHGRPNDFNRWTTAGLKQLLIEGGFEEQNIETSSWGNKACARAHIGGPVRDYGFKRDLSNDPEYPLMVWAFARNNAATAPEN